MCDECFPEDENRITLTEEDLAPRVTMGVVWARGEFGPGWFKSIYLDTFDMENGQFCVFGYCDGGYWSVVDRYAAKGVSQDVFHQMGFSIGGTDDEINKSASYKNLTNVWVKVIDELKAEAA